jgi:hypothetical protein
MKLDQLINDILALDSFYNYLSWYERCWLHLLRMDKVDDYASTRIAALANFVDKSGWSAPQRKPGEDKLGYYFENGKWHDMEDYPKNHPHITEHINKLQYYGTSH